jgi:hypothetical protein
MKRLAMLSTVLALVCASSPRAYAISLSDPGVLGIIVDAIPFGDADVVKFVNIFLDLAPSTGPVVIGTETYTRNSTADPGSGQVASVGTSGTSTTTAAGYEYIAAKYDGMNGGAVIYYAGGASLALPKDSQGLWQNVQNQGYGLSGWKAFNAVNVPDGGSTVAFLGFAVLGLGALRRRLIR